MELTGSWDRVEVDRRTFLARAGASAAALTLAANGLSVARAAQGRAPFSGYPFTLGVASGDPLPSGVVLWTRLAPDPLAGDGKGGVPARTIPVRWEVAEDERFRRVVRKGQATATPELAHSAHVEVNGLRSGRDYFYRFVAAGQDSPVARTRTAPASGAPLRELDLGIVSCQSWSGGPFAAYRTIAQEDLDVVLHLGDYIYEEGDTETLTDFRLLYSKYKRSKDLMAAHAAFPFVLTLDDHEIENNWAGLTSQTDNEESNSPERFTDLRAAAFQAYYENLPLRRGARPVGPDMMLYRRLAFGDLLDMSVLDTRQYRSDQVEESFPFGPLSPDAADPGRTMTGAKQERWLLRNLDRSRARWNAIAQQTIMAQFDYDTGDSVAVNHDQWDGYSAARQRILEHIARKKTRNPVVLSGDWHSSWVNDLKLDWADEQAPVVASEFAGTSVSSGCGWADDVEAALPVNPHVKFFDGTKRGYIRSKITRDRWVSDYRAVASAADRESPATTLTSWVVDNGRAGARQA